MSSSKATGTKILQPSLATSGKTCSFSLDFFHHTGQWLLHVLLQMLLQVLMQLLLGIQHLLVQLLLGLLHLLLKLLRLALHLHLELLTQRLKLLHVVVVDGNGLMWHWLLRHLIQRLAHMVMVTHGMLMHLQAATECPSPCRMSITMQKARLSAH